MDDFFDSFKGKPKYDHKVRVVHFKKEHFDIYHKYCHTGYPHDFEMFIELYKNKNICLVSSIPAYSTHCETAVLAPLIDWEINSLNNI